MDSLQRVHAVSRVENDIIWRIPIRFWIMIDSDASLTNLLDDEEDEFLPEERELQRLIDDANFAFSNADVPTRIRFYIKDVGTIRVNNASLSSTNLILHLTANSRFIDQEAINVYIRATGHQYYFAPANHIVLNRRVYSTAGRATSFTHELGHYLGLAHTHQYLEIPCLREPVVRGNSIDAACAGIGNYDPVNPRCSYTGDYLCDTEADPNMSWRNVYNTANCSYIGNEEDYRGDRYRPLPHNYMAYGNNVPTPTSIANICRRQFTREQVGVMQYILQNSVRGQFGRWKVNRAGRSFDTYEPNNTISGAINLERRSVDNVLRVGTTQTHSFHQFLDVSHFDNEDWIPIRRPNDGLLTDMVVSLESNVASLIEGAELFTQGNTNGITISRALASPLRAVPNATRTRWEMRIPCTLFPDATTTLFLQVRRNRSLNVVSTYTITASAPQPALSISNAPTTTICQSSIYNASLASVPANTTIAWFEQVRLDNGFVFNERELTAHRNLVVQLLLASHKSMMSIHCVRY